MTSESEADLDLLCALTRPGVSPLLQWNITCMEYLPKEDAKDMEITGSLLIISSFSCNLWASTVRMAPACIMTEPNPSGTQRLFLTSQPPFMASACIQVCHTALCFGDNQ